MTFNCRRDVKISRHDNIHDTNFTEHVFGMLLRLTPDEIKSSRVEQEYCRQRTTPTV